MKMFKNRKVWVMAILLAICIMLQGYIKWQYSEGVGEVPWTNQLKEENENLKEQLQEIPDEIRPSFESIIAHNNYLIEHDISPHEITAWSFARDSLHFTSIITLFMIMLGAEIMAAEFGWGTITLLLIRPIKRYKILIAKYLTLLSVSLMFIVFLLVFSVVAGGIIFGFGGFSQPHVYSNASGEFLTMDMHDKVLISLLLRAIGLIVMVTLAYMISTAFRNGSIAVMITLIVLFIGNTAVPILEAMDFEWTQYLIFANMNLSAYLEGKNTIDTTLPFSLIVLFIHWVIFLLVTWVTFVRRDIA